MSAKAKRYQSRHHLIPKERVKLKTLPYDYSSIEFSRTLKLYQDKHNAWHILFRTMTLPEIIALLQRVLNISKRKETQ